jgi:hypothetical protein
MDLKNILAQLRRERDELDVAISKLESLDCADRNRESTPRLVTKTTSNGTSPVHRTPNSTSEQL